MVIAADDATGTETDDKEAESDNATTCDIEVDDTIGGGTEAAGTRVAVKEASLMADEWRSIIAIRLLVMD